MDNMQMAGTETRLQRFRRLYLKTVGILLAFLLSFAAAYAVLHRDRLFPAPEDIVVYGSDRCSVTADLRARLDAEAIPYTYANIDNPLLAQELALHLKLTEARAVRLPVVLVAGQTIERPPQTTVTQLWRAARDATH